MLTSDDQTRQDDVEGAEAPNDSLTVASTSTSEQGLLKITYGQIAASAISTLSYLISTDIVTRKAFRYTYKYYDIDPNNRHPKVLVQIDSQSRKNSLQYCQATSITILLRYLLRRERYIVIGLEIGIGKTAIVIALYKGYTEAALQYNKVDIRNESSPIIPTVLAFTDNDPRKGKKYDFSDPATYLDATTLVGCSPYT